MSAQMTKLDCVNSLLSIIGELPVTTLEDTLNADAVLAIRVIDDTVRDTLSEGWCFNMEYDVTLQPDINGEITLTDNVIACDIDPLKARGKDVVLRGRRLYDRKNHTYIFDAPLHGVILQYHFEYDDLPLPQRQYVLAVAKARFHSMIIGDATLASALLQDVQRARVIAVADDLRQTDRNFLDRRPNSLCGFSSFHNALRR